VCSGEGGPLVDHFVDNYDAGVLSLAMIGVVSGHHPMGGALGQGGFDSGSFLGSIDI